MKRLAKTYLNQGHGKIGYIFEFTETEVLALRKYFDGKKFSKGCALDLGLQNLRNEFPTIDIPQERMAQLLNPRLNHAPYNDSITSNNPLTRVEE